MAGSISITNILRQQLKEARNDLVLEFASGVVNFSPVDTGAFVNSWSISTTSNGGRSISSRGKPRKQPPEVKKAEAISRIQSDLDSFPADLDVMYFNNRAPHANFVEGKYGTISRARSRRNAYGPTPRRG